MRALLALVLVACGDPSSPPPASCGDPGTVTVDGPNTTGTATFIAHDANGEVVDMQTGASNATVTLTMPSCGMVTTVTQDSSTRVFTWTGVKPGDHLVDFDHQVSKVDKAVAIQVPALANATEYQVTSVCDPFGFDIANQQTPGEIDVTLHCQPSATTVSIVAVVTTPTGKSTATATVPLAADTTSVTLGAYAAAKTSTATVHHADAFVGGSIIYGPIALLADLPVIVDDQMTSITSADASIGPLVALDGPGIAEVLVAQPGTTPQHGNVELVRGVTNLASDFDVDTSELLALPTGSIDAATSRPTVTWSVDGATTADAVLIDVDQGSSLSWTLFGPPTPGAVRFPDVSLVPAGAFTLHEVDLLDATSVTSYDEARATGVVSVNPAAGEDLQLATTIFGATSARQRRPSATGL